ncbi:MAG TPA: FeoA family protein [Opitutaceae bacterium]|nr:FeoA family protein [Opitutaceae bacterium]
MQDNRPALSGPPRRIPLSELPRGSRARICSLEGDSGFCTRLREIGFCETALIERLGGTETLLCRLCQSHVALSSAAARRIVVEFIAA